MMSSQSGKYWKYCFWFPLTTYEHNYSIIKQLVYIFISCTCSSSVHIFFIFIKRKWKQVYNTKFSLCSQQISISNIKMSIKTIKYANTCTGDFPQSICFASADFWTSTQLTVKSQMMLADLHLKIQTLSERRERFTLSADEWNNRSAFFLSNCSSFCKVKLRNFMHKKKTIFLWVKTDVRYINNNQRT